VSTFGRSRAGLAHRQFGDAQVLARDAVRGVADDERDVRALDRPLRAEGRVVLDGVLDLRLAAQARRVDEDQAPPVDLQREVDRVAGRSGDVAHDHALGPEQAVDERGLADVRAPDDGEADDVVVLLLGLVLLGQQLDDAVEQIAGAEPLGGRHGDRVAQAEREELGRRRDVVDGVDLVGRDDDRLVPPPSSSSPGRSPARASTTKTASSASARAACACSRIEPEIGSGSRKSMPPVSMSAKLRPFHSASISLRSRVMPARSWTTAWREPLRRLTREDFPTLG
jgi:hypothetical protein